MFTDTHCHIHEAGYPLDADEVIESARKDRVDRLICVGTSANDSKVVVDFVSNRDGCWASIGQHPHEASAFNHKAQEIMESLVTKPKVVAIGECGLDYWYLYSDKASQQASLRWQLNLAVEHNLPIIFHNRGSKANPQDAFSDLWLILEDYPSIRGVIHSFSADKAILQQILDRNFSVGINGIMTFTKDLRQLESLDAVPVDKMVLETDAPFLTPSPLRGKVNEPKHLVRTAEFIAERRGISLTQLEQATSRVVESIFNLS